MQSAVSHQPSVISGQLSIFSRESSLKNPLSRSSLVPQERMPPYPPPSEMGLPQ